MGPPAEFGSGSETTAGKSRHARLANVAGSVVGTGLASVAGLGNSGMPAGVCENGGPAGTGSMEDGLGKSSGSLAGGAARSLPGGLSWPDWPVSAVLGRNSDSGGSGVSPASKGELRSGAASGRSLTGLVFGGATGSGGIPH